MSGDSGFDFYSDYDNYDDNYDEDDFEEEEGYFYKIGDYTGICKFWDSTHSLSKLYSTLYDVLVPSSGSASTKHGELLRMISRLVYDVFNNGLCNDKTEECKYLLNKNNFESYSVFLNNIKSVDIIKRLLDCQERDYLIDLDQNTCDQLDDVIQAVIKYCCYQIACSLD